MKTPPLLTKETRERLPALYSQEHVKDPIVYAKFFTPDAGATWLVTEFDGEDLFFGWACLGNIEDAELGYFSLSEIGAVRGALGLPVERDLWFSPCPLSKAKGGVAGFLRDGSSRSSLRIHMADDTERVWDSGDENAGLGI